MPRKNGQTQKEALIARVAAAVGAGRSVAVETVDFNDPDRPRTCLEVDFPIIPINQIAQPEASSGAARKPIYTSQKWWARRASSVFRGMLISAATRSPEDESRAAKAVWEQFYANHQAKRALRHIRVADPFMGGGTTLIEGARLGMQIWGCDLNPVAWFVVRNELAQVNLEDVRRLIADVEEEVKPMLMPYYACDGPGGEKGKWFHKRDGSNDWQELEPNFDILAIPWNERPQYRYKGPEIIYTFLAKHGPCQRAGCGHRTPIMSTPVVAVKSLSVSAWLDQQCGGSSGCGAVFDLEQYPARMAPDAPLYIAQDEKPFAVLNRDGAYACPQCGRKFASARSAIDRGELNGLKPKNKKVELTLLMHPQWLDGCPAKDENGRPFGGSHTDDVESTCRWNEARAAKLRILEVRGALPEQVKCPETGVTFYTDERGGTAPLKTGKDGKLTTVKSAFACRADGSPNDNLQAIKSTGKIGPMAAYVIQCYSSERSRSGVPYGGRFFAAQKNFRQSNAAVREWNERKDSDLAAFWPRSEIPFGFMTHMNNGGIPNHGYSHWWKMFDPLQLLTHAQLLRAIVNNKSANWETKDFVLGAFQQFLRANCSFSFWNLAQDCLEPCLGASNFHPKSLVVENTVFNADIGRGSFRVYADRMLESREYATDPWDLVYKETLELPDAGAGKTEKIKIGDPVDATGVEIDTASATDLAKLKDGDIDLVITDPPFGGLLHYSELSDFFYVWLRLALKDRYPALFGPE